MPSDARLNQLARVPELSEPAKVFEDRITPGDWRVEWFNNDGGCEVAILSGPNARELAIRYAERKYGDFEEISLSPYPPPLF
jgi:hypothetical protein